MVLLARGNESVLLDLGLVERLYFNSGGLHSADLIFYGLQYVFPGLWLMLFSSLSLFLYPFTAAVEHSAVGCGSSLVFHPEILSLTCARQTVHI